MAFQFRHLLIPAVIEIQSDLHKDHRGFFAETYRHSIFATQGIAEPFVQDNWSNSVRGVLRGLHYQRHPMAQAKLVLVLKGDIFDVAVDLRKGSSTYGKWVGVLLSAAAGRLLYVPAGFAHGFCVLSDEATVLYKVTKEYAPECEGGVVWNDPEIGIAWPIQSPVIAKRDAEFPRLRDADHNFQ